VVTGDAADDAQLSKLTASTEQGGGLFRERSMQQQKESRIRSIENNVWALPVWFCMASGSLFLRRGGGDWPWFIYFAGWATFILMGLWSLLALRKPAIPSAPIALAALVVSGILFLYWQHDSLPF
jgi:hypothetical protein